LARQHDPGFPWDVVVVDNDGAPESETVVVGLADGFPVPLQLVREARRGTSPARNRGIAVARGEVIAFLDDDVVPEAHWLCRLVEPVRAGRCHGVGGRIVLDPAISRPRWYQDWMGGYLAEFHLGDGERELSWDEYVLTANAAFCTDVLRSMGGFDVDLGPRDGVYLTNEDVDLCRRLMTRAGPMRYVPAAVVVHEMPASRLRRRYVFRRLYAQGRSAWMLDRQVLGDSFLDGFVELAWPRICYLGRLGRYEGIWKRAVALRAICEVAQIAGMLRQAASATLARRRGRQEDAATRANIR
jgi:GT2 family glycosyltransferase